MEIFYILFGLIGFIVSIVWLVFPFIVIGKFNELIKLQKEANSELQTMRYIQSKEDRASNQI